MQINPTTLKDIAALIGAEYIGNENHLITGFNEIHRVNAEMLYLLTIPNIIIKHFNL